MKNLILFLLIVICVFGCSKDDDPIVEPPIDVPVEEPGSLKVGLLAHFDFDGGVDDVSGAGYTGIIHGAKIATDRNGSLIGAFEFDGVDDFIDYGQISALGLGGFSEYTMTAWIKPMQTDSVRHVIFSKFNGGVSAGWYLGINTHGKVQAYRNVVPWSVVGDQSVTWGEFIHVAVSYDGANLTVYVNGKVDSSVPFTSQPNDLQTPVLAGAAFSQNNVIPSFEGVIDDFRIYNRVLTDDEFEYLVEN